MLTYKGFLWFCLMKYLCECNFLFFIIFFHLSTPTDPQNLQVELHITILLVSKKSEEPAASFDKSKQKPWPWVSVLIIEWFMIWITSNILHKKCKGTRSFIWLMQSVWVSKITVCESQLLGHVCLAFDNSSLSWKLVSTMLGLDCISSYLSPLLSSISSLAYPFSLGIHLDIEIFSQQRHFREKTHTRLYWSYREHDQCDDDDIWYLF